MNQSVDPTDASVIVYRNEFYRDGSRKLCIALIMSIGCLLILIGVFIFQIKNPPEPKFFAINSSGRVMPLVPLNQPNISIPSLLQWANMAAVAAYSYNFVNYRQELQSASEFFTPSGWKAFLDAIQESRNLEAVISKKLVVSAVAAGAPVVLEENLENGVYYWKVQMPILITYQSASSFSKQSAMVNMKIVRVSVLRNPRGVGIDQFIVSNYSSYD